MSIDHTPGGAEIDQAAARVDEAVAALRAGALVAFPTETVYGLGADAGSADAVAKIFAAKGRPTGHPLIVHTASPDGLDQLGRNVGPAARLLAAAFWPGPLTLIVDRSDRVVPEATGGRDTVGIRVPDHPLTLALLEAFGGGVAGPSANRFGSVSPTTAQHVADDLGSAVDVILDGGPCRVGLESTIVDVTGSQPMLLRPGGVSVAALQDVLGAPVLDDRSGPSRASGMLASHYAPDVALRLVAAEQLGHEVAAAMTAGVRVGVMAPAGVWSEADRQAASGQVAASWVMPDDAETYATMLYDTLRQADRAQLDQLVVVAPTSGPTLDAVVDRLTKAAAPR